MEDKKEVKANVKNEDVLEEIEDIVEIEESPKEAIKLPEIKDVSNEEEAISDDVILEDVSNDSKDASVDTNVENETKEDNSYLITDNENKKKIPIIVLLSILLVIDIAALVIYLIGIEKVVSFIK